MNRSTFRSIAGRVLVAALGLLPGAALAGAQQLNFAPFHKDGVYALGDTVGWTVTARSGKPVPTGTFTYHMTKNNLDIVKTGSFKLTDGKATIEATYDEPAMLYVTVDYETPPPAAGPPFASIRQMDEKLKALLTQSDPSLKAIFDKYPNYALVHPQFPGFAAFEKHRVATLGAAVEPTEIQPAVMRPADFDAFWAGQLAKLKQVPIDPVITPVSSSQSGVKVYRVKLASVGSHVQGYLAKPDRPGKFPALVIYQWAGVYALNKAWSAHRAAEGWLTLDVDSHDLVPGQATGVPNDYAKIGDHSRDASYFLEMYLRDTRALDYIQSRADWDGKTIVVMGTSMGGQQSLVTAGLNPGRVTAVIVNEPSGADSNGDLHGRKAGYPNWDPTDPQVMKTALYFDTVNFASHITTPALVAMGFIDTTAPPVGIWADFNQIRGPKEAVPMIESDHNNRTPEKQGAFLQRSEEVLATIVHGGRFIPDEQWKQDK